MKYTLAKQLKDAGFPQSNSEYSYRDCSQFGRGIEVQYEDSATGRFLCCIPDLSVLIEACGEKFGHLTLSKELVNRWIVHSEDMVIYRSGKTPEEAVAKLWLALNED